MRAEGYFKRAYQIAPTPRAMAQLGLVELALGDFAACERYLSDALADDDAWVRSYQKTIEDSRRTARSHLLQIVVTDAPPGTSATVGKGRHAQLGADGVLWLPPDETTVVFAATGFQPKTTTVHGQAGTIHAPRHRHGPCASRCGGEPIRELHADLAVPFDANR